MWEVILSDCGKKKSYEQVSNYEWLPRNLCLDLRIKNTVNCTKIKIYLLSSLF